MTREFLFRGKRKDNGEWIEGSLVKSGEGDCFIYPTGCRAHKTGVALYEFICNPIYEVIPETVGMFTGRLDKYEKKIFEGQQVVGRTDWNLGTSLMRGKVVYDSKYTSFQVLGTVDKNTDGRERCFDLHDCWDIQILEDE